MMEMQENAIDLDEYEANEDHSGGEDFFLEVENRSDVRHQKDHTMENEDNVSNISGKEHAESSFSIIQGRSKVVFLKDNVSGMYKCHLCRYQTLHRSSMRSHYAIHSDVRPYSCDLCPYEAKRLCDLKKHKVLKHGKTLQSLRKNQWRGRLGNKALKKDQLQYNDMLAIDPSLVKGIDMNSSKAVSRTRSGIPIEIVEDEEDDEEDNFSYMDDPVFNNDSSHMSTTPVFPEATISNNADSSLHTPPSSEHSATHSHESVFNSQDKPATESMLQPDMIKTEPGEFIDYFSKRYFDSMNKEESESVIQRHESGYISETRSAEDKQAGSGRASSTLSGQDMQLPQRKNVSGNTLLRKVPSRTPTPSQTEKEDVNDVFAESSQQTLPPLLYRGQSISEQSHTPAGAKSWKCPYCVIVFYDSALYFMHMGLHNGREPWKCNLCGKKYHDVYGFTSHFVNGHANSC